LVVKGVEVLLLGFCFCQLTLLRKLLQIDLVLLFKFLQKRRVICAQELWGLRGGFLMLAIIINAFVDVRLLEIIFLI
jgi:hypothetical protein